MLLPNFCSLLAAVAVITLSSFCAQAQTPPADAQPTPPATSAQTTEPAAPSGTLALELNRLENQPRGCRVYLVLGNDNSPSVETLHLDLVLFGHDGVLQRRMSVNAGPLRADRRTVKQFDIADTNCDSIGSILVNDIPQCSLGTDCLSRLSVSSRAGITLDK